MKKLLPGLFFIIFHLAFSPAGANSFSPAGVQKYTDEHPLVIVGDWDFRPFEFVNIEGKPAGYNVDVLNMILDELGIPHKFIMQEWHVATDMFKRHEADLIHALHSYYNAPPYYSTQKYINYYNLKVARRTDTTPFYQFSQLQPSDKLIIREDDYAALTLAEMDSLPFRTEFHSPKDALTGISQGRYKYYIWGELPLSMKIQELSLDSIVLDEIDFPTGELRIIGYNEELIDLIDDQYTRLEQAGKLQNIYDHWFNPEREYHDASPIALFILAGLLLTAIVVFLLTWLVRQRVNMKVRESSDLGQIMNQVLNMGDYFVLEWDFQSNMLRNKYGNMLPNGDMKPEEFLSRMTPKEAQHLHSLNMQLATGVISHFDLSFSFNQGTTQQPLWKNYYGNAIAEWDQSPKQPNDQSPKQPQHLLYTIKDITNEVSEERRVKTLASKYKNIFDTNLVAMSFYDANGKLINLNSKMKELCQIAGNDAGTATVQDRKNEEQFFHTTSLFSFPNLKGIYNPGSREVMHVCQHLQEPQLGLNKYIEFRIQPVIDDNNTLLYYIATNRDVTAERNMYLQQKKHDRQLKRINQDTKQYQQQLAYLLEESKMYIWTYRPAENVINLTRTPGQTEFTETIEEYLQSINQKARQKAITDIQQAILQQKSYNTILPFDYTPLDKQPTWYAVSGIPIHKQTTKQPNDQTTSPPNDQTTSTPNDQTTNSPNDQIEYFGLSRDITELMQIQEKLRIETTRAQDSGQLKAAFLANMTHEIRTPLNAIVGFSEILPNIQDHDEKKELIHIIQNNCDMLLRLISDILQASDISSRTLDIHTEDVDFAHAFDDICQSLQQRVQTSAVQFIKDNPYDTLQTKIDKERIQQVITNFVTNAVKYTQKGYIKVGYRTTPLTSDSTNKQIPTHKGLYIYCQDTGSGIPKEKQQLVFQRFVKLNEFVQGTGLGLNICKSIAEQCGGRIGVHSEGEGQGATFWIWIPCPIPTA